MLAAIVLAAALASPSPSPSPSPSAAPAAASGPARDRQRDRRQRLAPVAPPRAPGRLGARRPHAARLDRARPGPGAAGAAGAGPQPQQRALHQLRPAAALVRRGGQRPRRALRGRRAGPGRLRRPGRLERVPERLGGAGRAAARAGLGALRLGRDRRGALADHRPARAAGRRRADRRRRRGRPGLGDLRRERGAGRRGHRAHPRHPAAGLRRDPARPDLAGRPDRDLDRRHGPPAPAQRRPARGARPRPAGQRRRPAGRPAQRRLLALAAPGRGDLDPQRRGDVRADRLRARDLGGQPGRPQPDGARRAALHPARAELGRRRCGRAGTARSAAATWRWWRSGAW